MTAPELRPYDLQFWRAHDTTRNTGHWRPEPLIERTIYVGATPEPWWDSPWMHVAAALGMIVLAVGAAYLAGRLG